MKILIEWPRSSTYSDTSFAGGVEKWTAYIFNLLSSKYDTQLLAPNDSVTDNPNVILSPLPSRPYDKRQFKVYDYAAFYEHINELSKDYDKVLLTSMLGSRKIQKYPELCSKVVYVQHYYEYCSANAISFSSWFNQLFIQKQGGFSLTPNDWVKNKGNLYFQERLWDPACIGRLGDGVEYLKEMFDKDLYNGYLTVIHHLEDAVPLKPLNEKKVVFVGRSVEEKGIVEACRAMIELDKRGYECHIYTRDEKLSKQKAEQAVADVKESGVQIHLNTPHAEIMDSLSDTHILLWPTRKETVGIVGYEGAVHGCKVIYKIDPPDFYLDGYGFKRSWTTWKKLVDVVEEVSSCDHDRHEVSRHFRDEYCPSKDLQRLEKWL